MNRKVLIIYHRVDFDGVFSCCVSKFYYSQQENVEVTTLGWTYGDLIPELPKDVDEIVMVDISFPPDYMVELVKNYKLTYIDHHQTAITASIDKGFDNVPGIREQGIAACELCWKYFFPNFEVPLIIQYLSTWDVWNKERFDWENDVKPLQKILKTIYGMSETAIYADFPTMISPNYDFTSLLEKGRLIQQYENKQFRAAVKAYSFPITVNGKYKGVCMLTNNFGSGIFESVLNDYDIYVTANRRTAPDGRMYFAIGMYAEPGRIDFSLGEYLRGRFGTKAGGHPCAAGSEIDEETFRQLIIDQVI